MRRSKKFYEVVLWWLEHKPIKRIADEAIYVYLRGVESDVDAERAAVHIVFTEHPDIEAVSVKWISKTDRRKVRDVTIHDATSLSEQVLDGYKVTPAVNQEWKADDTKWAEPDANDWYHRPKPRLVRQCVHPAYEAIHEQRRR